MDPVICTVDVVLLTLTAEGLEVALLKREHAPFKGVAALPGGYIHARTDTDARDAARRVLLDKTGIAAPYLEQLATFSGAARDPRGWSVSIAYYALVPAATIAQAERHEVRLYSVDRLPPLPFDHGDIIETAVSRLRSKSQYSSLPCHLLGEVFTLPQLQRVYEVLMGGSINKVSFRRKMTEMDMLDPVDGQFDSSGAHRPAQLYRLKPAFREQLQLLERGL
ncbi:NUDIX hydrolase [Herbaspirillum camelliae]|uniref:NUDIX hydrolase n=1 Tax=Herbaspirillum camelliae TaxID=1892903 RepID=UPI000949CA07|nr:NUDIX domain-containing protein [Herbaspirillum camelliae]